MLAAWPIDFPQAVMFVEMCGFKKLRHRHFHLLRGSCIYVGTRNYVCIACCANQGNCSGWMIVWIAVILDRIIIWNRAGRSSYHHLLYHEGNQTS
jgi:hypothetical protein